MALVFADEPNRVHRIGGPVERVLYRLSGIDADEDMTLAALRAGDARVQRRRPARRLPAAARAAMAAAESAGLRRGQRRFGDEHRDQLRHEHELAGLRRRIDDELSDADARARRAELPVGRDRHRRADRADPRLRAPQRERRRQLLGRHDALHALRAAAAFARRARSCSSRRACRRTSSRTRTCRCCSRRRRSRPVKDAAGNDVTKETPVTEQIAAARPRRVADRDQAARHERRRLLQRQLGASVREPDAAQQLPRSARRSC